MTDVYVIRNQLGQYWGKSKAWTDGRDAHAVQHSKHEDEALNTLFELSSKDFELRGEVLRVARSERGEPVVEPSEHPLPAAAQADADQDAESAAEPPRESGTPAEQAAPGA